MNKLTKFQGFKGFTKPAIAALLPLLAAGAVQAEPVQAEKPASAWQITATQTPGVIRLTNSVRTGALHAICTASKCDLFVEPKAGCKPGTVYPLLVNSAQSMGVMPARCVLVSDNGTPRLVAHVGRAVELTKLILSDTDISIAFPTQAGPVSVLDIAMRGTAQVFADALRTIEGQPEQSGAQEHKSEKSTVARIIHGTVSRYQI